ncbi:MAG TPA: hypothetical protein VNW89_09420, partial [Stellaceae bacterium]|nr:hypothetical protein [Stellaceae bacterium]
GSTASEDANKRRPNRGLLRGGGAGGGSEMEGEHDAGYGGVRSSHGHRREALRRLQQSIALLMVSR